MSTAALTSSMEANAAHVVENFPITDALQANGASLSPDSLHWLKRWKGMNLEDPSFTFTELGGQTSITMRIRKTDPSNPGNPKGMGAFTPRNGAGNPNTGIAYFNMAAILGYDGICRPGVRYEAGPRATAALKSLIEHAAIKGGERLKNKARILKDIAAGGPLKGYVKASKPKDGIALNSIGNPHVAPNGAPAGGHPIIAALQASNAKPKAGTQLTLAKGYVGDELELAREYSVIMTLDAIFGQWDRYSGDNLYVRKGEDGRAYFYAVDNDGSDIGSSSSWTERNLSWLSRYDRNVIARLKEVYEFLGNPAKGLLGYTDANKFIVDLGLYFELPPATYVERIKRNLMLLFQCVSAVEAKYGNNAYLD